MREHCVCVSRSFIKPVSPLGPSLTDEVLQRRRGVRPLSGVLEPVVEHVVERALEQVQIAFNQRKVRKEELGQRHRLIHGDRHAQGKLQPALLPLNGPTRVKRAE